MAEKTASIPVQNVPVVTAHGYSRRQETVPGPAGIQAEHPLVQR